MLLQFNTDDVVLVFGQYEGVIVEQRENTVLVYCPDFNIDEPYLVTHIDNVILIEQIKSAYIN